MRSARVLVPGLVLLVLLATVSQTPAVGGDASPAQSSNQVTVWALTSSKVYHCPKSRWYGKGGEGKFLEECQALREGYRPAFGISCGSNCR